MSKPFYVNFDVPGEVVDATYEALSIASESVTGNVRKGTNEATKAIERGKAKLVVIAEDVDPPEVVAHLPLLCEERKVPYIFVSSKEKLGISAGLDVPAASASITDAGEAAALIEEISNRIEKLEKKGSPG